MSYWKHLISAGSTGLGEFHLLVFLPLGVTFSEARQANLAGHGVSPMPREMAFPVPKGEKWHDHYDYIRYARCLWHRQSFHTSLQGAQLRSDRVKD